MARFTPDRARVKILTCDPATRRIEGGIRDGGVIQISVIETGPFFRWPRQEEIWTVKRRNNAWYLDQMIEQGELDLPIEELDSGEAKINADVIRTRSGATLLTDEDILPSTGSLWFNVKDYGALGDVVTDDTAAILATIAAAEENRAFDHPIYNPQAVVYFPAGIYKLTAELNIAQSSVISFMGDGPYASILYWDVDLGAGEYGLRDGWPANDNTAPFTKRRYVQDLCFLGRLSAALPQAAAAGLRLSTHMTLQRVICAFWNGGAGIEMAGNHQTVDRCWMRDCKYGIWFPDVDSSIGDQYIVSTGLSNNSFASMGVSNQCAMIAEIEDVHFGFGPYGIWCESGGTEAALNKTTIHKSYCEAFGNSFITTNGRNISRTAIRDTVLRRTDAQANGDAVNAVFDVGTTGNLADCVLDNVTMDLSTGSTLPPVFIRAGLIRDNEFRNMQIVKNHVDASNWQFATAPSGVENNRVTWGNGEAILVKASGTVTQKDSLGLLQFEGTAQKTITCRAGLSGDIPVGVAMHGAATTTPVLAQINGVIDGVPTSTAIAALDVVKIDSTGDVETAVAGDKTIGIARTADSGGVVKLYVKTGWPA